VTGDGLRAGVNPSLGPAGKTSCFSRRGGHRQSLRSTRHEPDGPERIDISVIGIQYTRRYMNSPLTTFASPAALAERLGDWSEMASGAFSANRIRAWKSDCHSELVPFVLGRSSCVGFSRCWLDCWGRENSGIWGNILPCPLVSILERFDVPRSSPGAGDLGLVIPMPRSVCPGGSSRRGLFLSTCAPA
jgi:hypothetical protein